jgi:glyoxylase-like metal-dependent hydrolase (beta-lactamase superfamily II)
VVWTPGHSPGHICLYDAQRQVFFSGDHILPVITPNISLRLPSAGNPLGDFINSLNKVKTLDVKLVLPAHEHIFSNLPARVKEIIQHHRHRNQEILDTLKTEPRTAYEISAEITWMPEFGGVKFHNLAIWDRRMAVSETLAHLEALRLDGIISQFSRDGIIYYRLGEE